MIWDVMDEDRVNYKIQGQLNKVVVKYFSNHFREGGSSKIGDQLQVLQNFPTFLDSEEVAAFDKPITLEVVESVLNRFSKDKSPGPKGRMIEFFLTFIDLVSNDMLQVVEQSRTEGYVSSDMKSVKSWYPSLILGIYIFVNWCISCSPRLYPID